MTEWMVFVAISSLSIIIWYINQINKAPNKYTYKNLRYTEIKLIKK